MTSFPRRHPVRSVVAVVGVAGALLLAGCTATTEAQPSSTGASSGPSAPSASTPTRTPSASPSRLATPAPVPGEIGRAEYTNGGPDGVPAASSIALDALTGAFAIEGECVGGSAAYRLLTAAPGEEQRQLAAGTMQCSAPIRNTYPGGAYAGPVQLQFTDTNDIDAGWLRVVPQ